MLAQSGADSSSAHFRTAAPNCPESNKWCGVVLAMTIDESPTLRVWVMWRCRWPAEFGSTRPAASLGPIDSPMNPRMGGHGVAIRPGITAGPSRLVVFPWVWSRRVYEHRGRCESSWAEFMPHARWGRPQFDGEGVGRHPSAGRRRC